MWGSHGHRPSYPDVGSRPLRQTISAFYEQLASDPHHRYRSWEHCYGFFRDHRQDLRAVEDTAALQLGFYLASWGMYRGSSFLLQHVYTAHVPVVRAVAASQFSALWQRDVGANDGDTDLAPTILALARSVTAAYEPFGTATDTLATKVILGTIGCLPACDRFFIKGFRTEGFQFSYLNAHFVDRILHYCIAHRLELAEQQATITARGGLEYPLMKLVDMHFWQIGYEMNQSSARRGDGSRPLPAAGER